MAGPAGPAGWQAVTQALAKALSPAGLDLVHPLRAGWWARAAERAGRPELALPHPDGALMVLVGNSRALWAPFCAAFAAGRLDSGRPLDDYVEGVLREAADPLPGAAGDAAGKTLYLTTEQYSIGPDSTNTSYVPFQRIAAAAGLAELVKAVHLSIHPEFGPWFALRGLLVFDGVDGPPQEPARLEGLLGAAVLEEAQAAFDAALAATKELAYPLPEGEEGAWRKFVAMRDAAARGRGGEHRYSDRQILYHYTNDLAAIAP